MQPDFRRKFYAAGALPLAVCLALFAPNEPLAGTKDLLSEKNGTTPTLQQVIRSDRPRGPVYVAIPIAYVFGLGGDRSPIYCSPSIRATNSSNMTVEELIVGIDYQTKDGRAVGTTVTRYDKIKIDRQDTHYFYQLSVSDCKGLDGKVTILRCVYSSGDDCSHDVQTVGFGAIPLHLSPR